MYLPRVCDDSDTCYLDVCTMFSNYTGNSTGNVTVIGCVNGFYFDGPQTIVSQVKRRKSCYRNKITRQNVEFLLDGKHWDLNVILLKTTLSLVYWSLGVDVDTI